MSYITVCRTHLRLLCFVIDPLNYMYIHLSRRRNDDSRLLNPTVKDESREESETTRE